MNEFIKLLRELLSMSEESKGLSSGRFAAFLVTMVVIAFLWNLPELVLALKAGN